MDQFLERWLDSQAALVDSGSTTGLSEPASRRPAVAPRPQATAAHPLLPLWSAAVAALLLAAAFAATG